MPNPISLKLVTTLIKQSEGIYRTYASLALQDKGYEEGDICGYDSEGVIVPAKVSQIVFETLLDRQRGDDVYGGDPVELSIVEGSVLDAETGLPIDPTDPAVG